MNNKKLLFFKMKSYLSRSTKSNIPQNLVQNKIIKKELIIKLILIQTINKINFKIFLQQMKLINLQIPFKSLL
jgi:hypothetical protein